MEKYILNLVSKKHGIQSVELILRTDIEKIFDYNTDLSDINVYDDELYQLNISNDNNTEFTVNSIFINDDFFDCNLTYQNFAVLTTQYIRPFLGCWGVVRLEIIINGDAYISPNLSVMVRKDSLNKNIINMIEYIYNNCEDFLYETHTKNRMSNDIIDSDKVTIDAKLSLLEKIYSTYIKCFNFFKNTPHSKLINKAKIGSFEKLRDITPNTIKYITTHVDELEQVNFNSGIIYNAQYYQPKNTLINSNHYTCNVYENQVVVGFIKTIIDSLISMRVTVKQRLDKTRNYKESNDYIESRYYIYTNSRKSLQSYQSAIDVLISDYQQLYLNLKTILNVSDYLVKCIPNFTNVFRNIMPYRLIYQEIYEWFNNGNYDLAKDDLILSFISTSKIYEYYCLLNINMSLIKNGYLLYSSDVYHYQENRYYNNTIYNNTFIFTKNDRKVTVYYQPVIFGEISDDKRNKILLYRNTDISIIRKGHRYTPDFLIKLEDSNCNRYYIMDAKYSTEDTVKKYELINLVYKYLFSISTLNDDDKLSGALFFCGKESVNSICNLHNISEKLGLYVTPFANIVKFSAMDENNYIVLEKALEKII